MICVNAVLLIRDLVSVIKVHGVKFGRTIALAVGEPILGLIGFPNLQSRSTRQMSRSSPCI